MNEHMPTGLDERASNLLEDSITTSQIFWTPNRSSRRQMARQLALKCVSVEPFYSHGALGGESMRELG